MLTGLNEDGSSEKICDDVEREKTLELSSSNDLFAQNKNGASNDIAQTPTVACNATAASASEQTDNIPHQIIHAHLCWRLTNAFASDKSAFLIEF